MPTGIYILKMPCNELHIFKINYIRMSKRKPNIVESHDKVRSGTESP